MPINWGSPTTDNEKKKKQSGGIDWASVSSRPSPQQVSQKDSPIVQPVKQQDSIVTVADQKKKPGFLAKTGQVLKNVGQGLVEGITGGRIKYNEPTGSEGTVTNFFAREFTKDLAAIPGSFIGHLEEWSSNMGKAFAAGDVVKAQASVVDNNIKLSTQLTERYKSETDPVKKEQLANRLRELHRSNGEMLKDLNADIPSNKDLIASAVGAAADVAFLVSPVKGVKSPVARVVLSNTKLPAVIATQRVADYILKNEKPTFAGAAKEAGIGLVEGGLLHTAGRFKTFAQRTLASGAAMGGIGTFEAARDGVSGKDLALTAAQNVAFGLAMPMLFGDRPSFKQSSFFTPDEQVVMGRVKGMFTPSDTVVNAYKKLGLDVQTTNPAEVQNRYRQLAKEVHPDKGGDQQAMSALNDAYQTAIGYENSIGGAVKNLKIRAGEQFRSLAGSPKRLPAGVTSEQVSQLVTGLKPAGALAEQSLATIQGATPPEMHAGITYAPEGKTLSQEYVAKAVMDAQKQIVSADVKTAIPDPKVRQQVAVSLENISSGTYHSIGEMADAIAKALPTNVSPDVRNLIIRQAVGQAPMFLSDPTMKSSAEQQMFVDKPKPSAEELSAIHDNLVQHTHSIIDIPAVDGDGKLLSIKTAETSDGKYIATVEAGVGGNSIMQPVSEPFSSEADAVENAISMVEDFVQQELSASPDESQRSDLEQLQLATDQAKEIVPQLVTPIEPTASTPVESVDPLKKLLSEEAKKSATLQEFLDSVDTKTLLHGGPSTLEGGKLSTGMSVSGDAGGVFFTPNTETGKLYARSYTLKGTIKTGDGTIHRAILSPDAKIFDASNPKDVQKLSTQVSAEVINDIMSTARNGVMDWATGAQYFEDIQSAGFDGAKLSERPAGFDLFGADGKLTKTKEDAISFVLFDNSKFEMLPESVTTKELTDIWNKAHTEFSSNIPQSTETIALINEERPTVTDAKESAKVKLEKTIDERIEELSKICE